MKYYEQLLESFKKLKKRTFKLTILEQDGGAEAKANAQIQTAMTQQATRDKPYEVPGISTSKGDSIVLFVTQKGVNWAPYSNKGIGFQQKTYEDPGRAKFIGFFEGKGEGEGETTTTKKKKAPSGGEPVPPPMWGATDLQPRYKGEDGYTALRKALELRESDVEGTAERAHVLEKLVGQKYFKTAREAWLKLCGKGNLLQKVEEARLAVGNTTPMDNITCNHLANSFAGAAGQSLENQFGEDMTYEGAGVLEAESIERALGNLKGLMEDLNKYSDQETLSAEDREALRRRLANFKFTSEGDVMMTVGDDSGIVLRDMTGVHAGMLREAQELANTDLDRGEDEFNFGEYQLAESELNASQLADERGKALEILKSFRSARNDCVYWKSVLGYRKAGIGGKVRLSGRDPRTGDPIQGAEEIDLDSVSKMPESDILNKMNLACKASEELGRDFTKHALSFEKMHKWASGFSQGRHALTVEEYHIYKNILSDHGDADASRLRDIIGGLSEMSRQADDALQSDITIPVGAAATKLNVGDKDDAIHIWKADCKEQESMGCNCDSADEKIRTSKGYDVNDPQRPLAEKVDGGINDPALGGTFEALGSGFKDYATDLLDGGQGPLCIYRNGIKNTVKPLGTTYVGVLKNIRTRLLGASRSDYLRSGRMDSFKILDKTLRRYEYLKDNETTDPELAKSDPNMEYVDPATTELNIAWKEMYLDVEEDFNQLNPYYNVKSGEDDDVIEDYDALQKHIDAIVAKARNATDYREQTQPSDLLELMDEEFVKEKLKTKQGRAYLIKFLKKYSLRHAVMPKIMSTIFDKKGNVNTTVKAKKWLKALQAGNFMTGAALHDQTSTEVHSLATGEMISVRHNEMMDFMDHPNTIITRGNDNTIRYQDPEDSGAYVEFEMSRDHDNVKWASRVSAGWLRKHGQTYSSAKQVTSSRASLVAKYLDQQKKLFELLLN